MKKCQICGTEISGRQKKFCAKCCKTGYREAQKHYRKSHRPEHASPVYRILCADCGKDMIAITKNQIRCSECAAVKRHIWAIMRQLRAAIANKAIVDPIAAIAFVQDMIQEDGMAFKEWAIDGIVERVIIDKRYTVDHKKR